MSKTVGNKSRESVFVVGVLENRVKYSKSKKKVISYTGYSHIHKTAVRRRVRWHRNDFGSYVSENGVCVRRLYRVAFTAYITVGERVVAAVAVGESV